MKMTNAGTLVAILANPPLTDGKRTLRRVDLAAELLGFHDVAVANLFSVPSHATGAIAELGTTEEGWLAARSSLDASLGMAKGVLLAYGAASPTGEAGLQFRRQVSWLLSRISAMALPTWHVGDGPRHPSRWQRWTYRAHPEVPFTEALRNSFVRVRVIFAALPTGSGPAVRGGETPLDRAHPQAQRDEESTCRSAS
jgi:hypothetical protein